MTRKRPRIEQATLAFSAWGGARKGAGRKPNGLRPLVPHVPRAALTRHEPAHVTWKLLPGLASLRRPAEANAVMNALLAARECAGLRVVHFTIQRDHLHLLAEADDARALSRGLQGLAIRIAKALNRLWRRAGAVFADRFHARLLRSPREVRQALAYVLCNANKHGGPRVQVDWASSGRWFDGWRHGPLGLPEGPPSPVAAARSWLLRQGWRRHGLIDVGEWPGGRQVRRA
jgi:REP element-mobilizing transposase RayT